MFSQQETERIIEVFIYEQNRLQKDDPVYFHYINAVKAVNLFSVTAVDRGIIRDFLFRWGRMGRTGKRPDDPKMSNIIQQYAHFLQRAQKQNLHTSNLQPDKQTIQDLFEELYKLVGSISTAKTLHLISPGFFPLWDTGIILAYNSSYKAKHNSKLIEMVASATSKDNKRASGKGYCEFMEFTKSFINKYHYKLSQIQTTLNAANPQKNNKTLLKMVDEFNMFATKVPFSHLL